MIDGYVATDLYETTAKDDESHKAVFVFDHETGEFLADQNGLYDVNEDTYWTENGEVVEYMGLVRTVKDDGEVNYYYFGEDNKAVKNVPEGGQDQWIPKEKKVRSRQTESASEETGNTVYPAFLRPEDI